MIGIITPFDIALKILRWASLIVVVMIVDLIWLNAGITNAVIQFLTDYILDPILNWIAQEITDRVSESIKFW
jgi:hypothetical protein